MKTARIREIVEVEVRADEAVQVFGREQLSTAFARAAGANCLSAEVRIEVADHVDGGKELAIMLVDESLESDRIIKDTRLYECQLEVRGLRTTPFILEALPNSFRYDRRVPAYGMNCGVELLPDGGMATLDSIGVSKMRPRFWGSDEPPPDLRFETLANDSVTVSDALQRSLANWGRRVWSEQSLVERARAGNWSAEMRSEAAAEAEKFWAEHSRIERGSALMASNEQLRRAFMLMNCAMRLAARGRYEGWRAFQFAFLLANLRAIVEPTEDSAIVDIVWFATGGGKTETYLGLLITAAIHDRLRGKITGISAWSRFPLRMLSLQQMQRFADAIAAADLVRREYGVGGDPFSLGFLVGFGREPELDQTRPRRQ